MYAIDVMGQPGKSVPDPNEPIREAADFVTWLCETLDGQNLDRISLVGISYGGCLLPLPCEKLAFMKGLSPLCADGDAAKSYVVML